MRLSLIDVFAEQPYAGNPLAVVRDCASLDTARMQAIAREINFSETTFVTRESGDAAEVRIFTPSQELPFAGHPSIGTAWVLRNARPWVDLHLEAGIVRVRFEDDGRAWLQPPTPELGERFDRGLAAQLLGLQPAELDDGPLPVQLLALGPKFLFVPVAGHDVLRRARLDRELHDRLLGQGHPVDAVYLFGAPGHLADGDYAVRLFFRTPEVREDPATGSAAACFAAYLREHRKEPIEAIVDQGYEIGRPSRLYLRAGDVLEVGGRVRAFAEGRLA